MRMQGSFSQRLNIELCVSRHTGDWGLLIPGAQPTETIKAGGRESAAAPYVTFKLNKDFIFPKPPAEQDCSDLQRWSRFHTSHFLLEILLRIMEAPIISPCGNTHNGMKWSWGWWTKWREISLGNAITRAPQIQIQSKWPNLPGRWLQGVFPSRYVTLCDNALPGLGTRSTMATG